MQGTNEVNLSSKQIDTRVDTQRGAQERALHDALRFSVVPTSRNKHFAKNKSTKG